MPKPNIHSNMHHNYLRIIHKTLLTRSVKFGYNQIPTTLPSLSSTTSTQTQRQNDYANLTKHFNHPVFINFVPNYKQLQENSNTAWLNLYINRNR